MDTNVKSEINNQDLQRLLDYISSISANLLVTNKDTIYKESQKPDNISIIKSFVTDQNTKMLCVTKIDNSATNDDEDQKQESKPDEVIFESEMKYKGLKSLTASFIKRDNSSLNISEKGGNFSNQLQVLNFNSEKNDMNMFNYLQNYIQGAFSPLFNSYQTTITENVSHLNFLLNILLNSLNSLNSFNFNIKFPPKEFLHFNILFMGLNSNLSLCNKFLSYFNYRLLNNRT